MVSILTKIMSLFGCRSKSDPLETPDIYNELRQQVLSVKAETILGSHSDKSDSVYGLLMETGYPEAVVTLVAMADGTVSLYFSNGGGIIGMGEHAEPRQACEQLLSAVPQFLQEFNPSNDYPLPDQGYVTFYILTTTGNLFLTAEETELGNNKHSLSPLFHKAQNLITAIRLAQEGADYD